MRRIAVGRKAWPLVGSDDHGQAAGNLLTLIASARLHGLDPEAYLRDIFRVFPHWTRDHYLELSPATGAPPAPASSPPSSRPSWAHSTSRRRPRRSSRLRAELVVFVAPSRCDRPRQLGRTRLVQRIRVCGKRTRALYRYAKRSPRKFMNMY